MVCAVVRAGPDRRSPNGPLGAELRDRDALAQEFGLPEEAQADL